MTSHLNELADLTSLTLQKAEIVKVKILVEIEQIDDLDRIGKNKNLKLRAAFNCNHPSLTDYLQKYAKNASKESVG